MPKKLNMETLKHNRCTKIIIILTLHTYNIFLIIYHIQLNKNKLKKLSTACKIALLITEKYILSFLQNIHSDFYKEFRSTFAKRCTQQKYFYFS